MEQKVATSKSENTTAIIQRQALELDIFQYFSLRRYFCELYAGVKKECTRYSYRSFSADLGYGETNFMHLVCSGKRNISTNTARTVVEKLGLSHARRKFFLGLARFDNARAPADRSSILEELAGLIEETLPTRMSKDQFAYFSNWHTVVIRELAARKDFRADANWISKQILPAITAEKAQEGLDLLVRIGYLVPEPTQPTGSQPLRLVPADIHVRSPKEAKSAALFRYHNQMIEHGRTSMSRIDGWRRDISGVTIRIDDDTMQQIKKEIQEFRARILNLSENCNGDGKQIYQLNVQFFPFTEADPS
jgi:uncharacterized protein (TIGR02147 family)